MFVLKSLFPVENKTTDADDIRVQYFRSILLPIVTDIFQKYFYFFAIYCGDLLPQHLHSQQLLESKLQILVNEERANDTVA